MVFECINKVKGKNEKWIGRIERLKSYGSYYEMVIESRSRIHVLFGAGCHIVDLRNDSWNKEALIHVLGRIDGITVACALKALADKITY